MLSNTLSYLEELTERDMWEGFMCSIPATATDVGLHVVLNLAPQCTLRAGVDHKLPRVRLIQFRVKDMGQEPEE